jgi:hypothetical protein
MSNNERATISDLALIIVLVAIVIAIIAGLFWAVPKYNVYRARTAGIAEFQRAESNRQIAVREAEARRDASEADAEAEVIRAQGVARANIIVADTLGGPEGYLRYLAIEAMRDQARSPNSTTIYVPTEANIPVTEASRFNKPQAVQP